MGLFKPHLTNIPESWRSNIKFQVPFDAKILQFGKWKRLGSEKVITAHEKNVNFDQEF